MSAISQAAPIAPPPASPRRLIGAERWIPLLLVLLTVFAYSNSLHGAFIFDDPDAIANNPNVTHPANLLEAAEAPKNTSVTGRPLVSLTLAANFYFGRLDVVGYHVVNIVIHALTGLALFGIIRRTMLRCVATRSTASLSPSPCTQGEGRGEGSSTFIRATTAVKEDPHPNPLPEYMERGQRHIDGGRFDSRQISIISAAAAALWLVHPLQTESVTYIVQRAESLCGLFYALTLYCFIRAIDDPPGRRWFFASIGACVLGMLSKEVMATAPLLVLLYEYVFVGPSLPALLRRRAGYYAGLLATWAIPIAIMRSAPRGFSAGFVKNLSAIDYLRSQPMVILHYLQLTIWPGTLVLDYGWPTVKHWSAAAAPGACIALLLLASLWGLWRRNWLGFLGVAFFLILAPSSSFVPLMDACFEHRMYLPLICITVPIAVGLWMLLRRRPAASIMIVAAAALALSLRTRVRNADYDSALKMWLTTLKAEPNNPRVLVAAGGTYAHLGQHAQAMALMQRAIAVDPGFAPAYDSLVSLALFEHDYADARKYLEIYVRRHPDDVLGWMKLAESCDKLGDTAGEIAALQQLAQIPDGQGLAYADLGRLYLQMDEPQKARNAFAALLKIDPQSEEGQRGLRAANALSGATQPNQMH